MTRQNLITLLESYPPFDPAEGRAVARALNLLESVPECYHRHEMRGHITGSALLLSRDGTKTLMNHHGFLQTWLHFGGHSDGDEDTFGVASRELTEESGIQDFESVFDGLFDLDVHPIPENPRKNEAAHDHYDCLYLFRCTGSEDFVLSEESGELRWMTPDDVLAHNATPRMQRLVKKWQMWQKRQALAA